MLAGSGCLKEALSAFGAGSRADRPRFPCRPLPAAPPPLSGGRARAPRRSFEDVPALSAPSFAAYAQRHGYDVVDASELVLQSGGDGGRFLGTSWYKVRRRTLGGLVVASRAQDGAAMR